MSNSIHRSFGLDFARALAISFVIISHFGHIAFGPLGFWGVELFFGLSGFLIGQILWRNFSKTNDWKIPNILNFWSRRWWRTLPNYYLFFLISLLFYHFNGDGLPPVSRLIDFLWFGQHLMSFSWGFYVVAWSLCVEEWFYLLFPTTLFFFSKFKLQHKASYICTLLTFFIGSIIIREILIKNGGGDALRTTTFARLDSIACGVGVSFILAIINPGLIWKRVSFWIGILLTLSPIFCVLFSNDKVFDNWIQNSVILLIVPMGFSLMLPVMSLLQPPKFGVSVITTAVEKISLWSYSIYLCHLPIMWTFYYVMNNYRSNSYINLLSKLLGLVITIIVSALLFEYFEKPLTKKRPNELSA